VDFGMIDFPGGLDIFEWLIEVAIRWSNTKCSSVVGFGGVKDLILG
jgi:hypothetical protein